MCMHSLVRTTVVMALSLLSAACATTHEPGWSGQGATPFGTAEADCRSQLEASAAEGREAQFNACMARHGWRRD